MRCLAIAALALCLCATSSRGASPGGAEGWVLLNESQGGLLLCHGRTPIAKVGVAAFGPNWNWKGFGKGQDQVSGGVLEQVGTIDMGGGQVIERVLRVEPSADGSITARLSVRAPQGATVHGVMLQVRPDKGFARDGAVTDAAGQPLSLALGGLTGNPDTVQLRTADGAAATVAVAGHVDVSSDGELRFGVTPQQMEAGKTYEATLTLRAPEPIAFIPTRDGGYRSTDTAGWFPYPVAEFGTPVDLSYLNKDASGNWVAAGGHGFLKVDGERFVFEDGTEARFWGLNLAARAALGDDARAEQVASRLARLGVNVVRLHHLDSPWSGLTLYDRKHPSGTTSQLDADALAKLDKLIFELKKRGIYIVLSPWVGFQVRPGDGIRDSEQFGEGSWSLHPYVYFDPAIQAHLQQYLRQVWTHENPHTGLAYKDDPAIVLTETINEGMIQRGGGHVKVDSYRRQFVELYQQWASANGRSADLGENVFKRNHDRDGIDFYRHLARDFHGKMDAFYKEIGVRVPASHNNWYMWAWELEPQQDGAFMEAHHYYGGDTVGAGSDLGGPWMAHPPTARKSPWGPFAGAAVYGKPLFISECGHNPPKIGRAAYFPALAAMAGFQGWDAITGYAYSQSSKPDTVYDGMFKGAYSWETDPAVIAGVAAGSVIFRGNHVRPAEQTVVMQITNDELYRLRWEDDGRMQHPNLPAFNRAIDEHRAVVVFGDELPAALRNSRVIRPDESAWSGQETTQTRSDTGELFRDWRRGLATIDTPRTQAVMGPVAAEPTPVTLSRATFECQTPLATIVLSSMGPEEVGVAPRLLLTAVAGAEPTGMRSDFTGRRIREVGTAPLLAEPVRGRVSFATRHERLYAMPVRVDGTHGPAIELPADGGRVALTLDGSHAALFYEIVDAAGRSAIEAADARRAAAQEQLGAAQRAQGEAKKAFSEFSWNVKRTDAMRELEAKIEARRQEVLAADPNANYRSDRAYRSLQSEFDLARGDAARAEPRGAELWRALQQADEALADARRAVLE